MKLYASPLACSSAVHITLIELGIPLEWVDIYSQPHVLIGSGAVYKDLNPKDTVPALELDSGELLSEVGVILQLLGDLGPESSLLPRPGTLARYRVMEWLSCSTRPRTRTSRSSTIGSQRGRPSPSCCDSSRPCWSK